MPKGAGVRGDFRPLHDIIKRAGRVASGELAAKSAHTFGRVVRELAERSIAAGTTPAGGRWKPTVGQKRALRGASGKIKIVFWKGGFKLVLPKPYKHHQTGGYRANKDGGREVLFGRKKGAWRMPARPLLPGRGKSIPKRWREPVIKALQEEWFKAWQH